MIAKQLRLQSISMLCAMLVGATVASVLLVSAVSAQAAVTESITLSPTSRKFEIKPGQSLSDKLTVVNDGTVDYDFLVYARPYSVKDNRYENPDFTNPAPGANLYKWVQIPETKYHLEAGKSTVVEYSITVPQDATPGGHYGVIFAEIQPKESSQQGNQVLRKKRVGTTLYTTVDGDIKLAGQVAGGAIPFWQLQLPLQATVAAQNTGNTHFGNTVVLTVSDLFGSVKYRSVKEYQVLPGTTRTINLEWAGAAWFGLYKVQTEQKFLDKMSKSEGYVLVMPRFIPFVIIIIVVLWGLYAVLHRRKK